ncbi:MAG: hypothetical protein E7175_03315 [Erysipelotrichaceae bacterium]|nr:hypothetical protein [Erysipelotrichaceae bacterium]
MHKFEIAIEILDQILDNKIPFNLATKNTLDKYSIPSDERSIVTGLVGCELRHHLLFSELIKEELELDEETKRSGLLLALANYHFYNKFDAQEVVAITSRHSGLDKKSIESFLAKHPDKSDIIPAKYDKGSFEYLSLRYNCPLWLVKMWNKHYGRGLAFKILQANTKPVVQSYKLNDVEQGKVMLNPNFGVAPTEDMVLYIGRGNAKGTDFYKAKQLIPEKIAYKLSLDKVDVKPFSKVAIYSSFSNTMYIDLAKRNIEGLKVDLITPDIFTHNEVRHHIAMYNIKNFTLLEEKAANLLACISEKVDYFFVLARNSNFDLLRTNADYFLRFSRDELDSIMNEQRYTLDEAATLMNEGGQLIYMVPTLNKKETKQIINEFLLTHREYSLLEERQFFPFEEENSTLYVARMLKVK